MPEAIILPIFFVSLFAAIIYWLYARARRTREVLQAQMDLQTRILDRFDSPQEFAGFLQTEGGQRFLAGLTERPSARAALRPIQRILTAVQIGIVVAMFGIGLCVIAIILAEQPPALFGVVLLSIGIGFLLAAGVSYRLSKGWGLLDLQKTTGSELLADLAG